MNHKFKPESLMMTYGYKPELSEGAIKCPIFQTSTFSFKTAEEGKSFFEVAYGKRERKPDEEPGLIYSRINNPNLEILEERLCLWDGAEECAVFSSGMAAISTVLLEFLKPGDLLVHSAALYGGTDNFIHSILPKFGIKTLSFASGQESTLEELIRESGNAENLALIYIETPANPTNDLIDISTCNRIAKRFETDRKRIPVAVDNTYMGPLWQQPIAHGADFVMYSATKYIAGHSDVIAGAVLGGADYMHRIKTLRSALGNMADPNTTWLLMRSLDTLKMRMERQQNNAQKVTDFLSSHPKIKRVRYLGLLKDGTPEYEVFQKQYSGTGAMVSFDVRGGESEAFRFLNALTLIKLAVSLGSTESLAQHPSSMTHCAVDPEIARQIGITESLVRLSVGVEDPEDLIFDLSQALEKV